MTPTFENCFPMVITLDTSFDYVRFIFSFCQEIACKFILFSFVFSILMIAFSRLFSKIIYTTLFFYKKNFYKKMSLKNHKTLRKC